MCRRPEHLTAGSIWYGTAPRSPRSRRAPRRSPCPPDRATRASTSMRPTAARSPSAARCMSRVRISHQGTIAGLKACATFIFLIASASSVGAQDLVTPVRVGHPDAPMTLSVWAQQDYSHLAARPAIASTFTAVFEDWARAHRDVQLRVSVMPGLELHKAKLQLAAAANRLPDIASIDSFWLPLLADHVQPLDAYWPADDRADLLPFTIQTLSRDG